MYLISKLKCNRLSENVDTIFSLVKFCTNEISVVDTSTYKRFTLVGHNFYYDHLDNDNFYYDYFISYKAFIV